jgi:hypothetical protein
MTVLVRLAAAQVMSPGRFRLTSHGALRDYPIVIGTARSSYALEVGVVVEHNQPDVLGRSGDQQIRNRGPVLATSGKGVL